MDWDLIKMNAWLVVLLILASFDKTRPVWISRKIAIIFVFIFAGLSNGILFIQLLSLTK
jgi:hypothetical protein